MSESIERESGDIEQKPEEGSALRSRVDALIILDVQGTVVATNSAVQEIFGISESELLGQNIKVLMPSPYREEHDGYLERYRETGIKNIIDNGRQVLARRQSGEVFPCDLTVSELFFGDEVYYAGVIRDLGGRIEIEEILVEQRARLEAILNTAVDAIITIDERGIIESANQAAVETFGYSRKEMLGRNVSMLMPDPYREEHDAYLEAYRQTRVKKIIGIGREVQGQCKDGSIFPMELSVSEVRFKDKLLFTGVVRDITERKRLVARLVEQESLASLGEMCAIVAHEIKNPLAGVIGALRMLDRRFEDGAFESELCEEMVNRLRILDDRVNDILSYARPRTPVIKSIPAEVLLEEVTRLVTEDPSFEKITLKILPVVNNLKVLVDPDLLRNVILNLLVNAAQALEGGAGTIILGAERAGDSILIRITDDGPGLDTEVIDKVFEPFFTTKHSGTGLGLAICRRFLRLQGGEIELHNRLEGGAEARITLPVDFDPSREEQSG